MTTDAHTATVSIGTTPYATRVTTGAHTFTADEPGSLGGQDTGPDPYGLLLSALGTCTVITVRMYADRKQWPLESVTAGLRHERFRTDEGPAERIDMDLSFEGDLTDEQRQRLLQIAGKCPVHKTITGDLHVGTKLVAAT
jgi:uncharacterized OsmC-like protein